MCATCKSLYKCNDLRRRQLRQREITFWLNDPTILKSCARSSCIESKSSPGAELEMCHWTPNSLTLFQTWIFSPIGRSDYCCLSLSRAQHLRNAAELSSLPRLFVTVLQGFSLCSSPKDCASTITLQWVCPQCCITRRCLQSSSHAPHVGCVMSWRITADVLKRGPGCAILNSVPVRKYSTTLKGVICTASQADKVQVM